MCNSKIVIFSLVFAAFMFVSAEYVLAAPYYGWQSEEIVDANTIGLWHWNASDGNAVNAVSGGLQLYKVGTVSYAAGKFGNGGTCPGGDPNTNYWQISNAGLLGYNMDATDADSSLSVAVWVNFNALPDATHRRQVIVDKAHSNDPNAGYQMYLYCETDNQIYLKAEIGSTGGPVKVSTKACMSPGRWTHMALVWDAQSDSLMLYMNGVLADTKVSAGSVYLPSTLSSTNPQILRVGQRTGQSYGTLNGIIDDLKISKSAISYAPAVVADGPYYDWVNEETVDNKTIGLWTWNGSSGHTYNLVPGKQVLYRNGTMGYAAGKFGNGGSCPGGVGGTDYWQIAYDNGYGYDMDAIGTDSNLAIAVWIKPDSLPTLASPRQVIYDKSASNNPTCGYNLYLYNDTNTVYLRAEIGTTSGTPVKISVPANLEVGQWAHIALVWSAQDDTLRLYKNGLLLRSTTSTGSVYRPSDGIAPGSTPYLLRVGNRQCQTYGVFNGVLDDLKISTAALQYRIPPYTGPYYGWVNDFNGTEADTVALWNFDLPYASGLGTNRFTNDVVTGESQKLYINGRSAIVTEGEFGWGLSMPGDQNGLDNTQVISGGINVFPIGTDPSLSVECWLKINNTSGQEIQYIFDKQYTDANGFKMYLARNQALDPGIASPNYRLHFVVGNGTTTVDVSKILKWEVGQWYHVAGTWDKNTDTAKLYRNGGVVASVSSLGMQIKNSAQPLRVGQRDGGYYWTFNGVIDNARISSNAYEYAFTCDAGIWLKSDISGPEGIADCYVDFYDLASLAGEWLNQEQSGSFFVPAPDTAAGYDSTKLYPQGKIFPFSIYSTYPPDTYHLKDDGFTSMGPYYDTVQTARLNEAANLGLKFFYSIGMDLNFSDPGFVMPSDAEIQSAITAQVNAVKNNNAIAVWNLLPEELQYYHANQMHYLQVAANAIRAADSAAGRPVWMYEQNNRTSDQLAISIPYQDLSGKGMYANFIGDQNNRIFCRWTVEQELAAIAAAHPSAVPIAIPEMYQDPCAADAHWIPAWTKHDVYSALVTGAKGVVVYSGYRREILAKYYNDYYAGYAKVADEITGSLNLGQVFLFGQRRSDITVTITSGPTTASMTVPVAYTASSINYANIADKTGARYLFLVNSANSSVTVNISGLPTGTIYREDLFATPSEYVAMSGGGLSVTLDPLGVKCYRFIKNFADISGPSNVSDGVVNLLDFGKMADEWMQCTDYSNSRCQ
jgi:hypothetical protein